MSYEYVCGKYQVLVAGDECALSYAGIPHILYVEIHMMNTEDLPGPLKSPSVSYQIWDIHVLPDNDDAIWYWYLCTGILHCIYA